MARKRKSQATAPTDMSPQQGEDGVVVDPTLPPLVPESQHVGTVVRGTPTAPATEPAPPDPEGDTEPPQPPQPATAMPEKPPKFRVRNGGKILHRGVLTVLKPGKVIDAGLYNVPQLKQQGIILDPM